MPIEPTPPTYRPLPHDVFPFAPSGAPKCIRVNTVIPGQLHTPMVEARFVTGTEIVVDGGMTVRCS